MRLRAVVAAGLVVALGTALLAAATEGFRTATTDGANRLAVAASPRPLPPTNLVDESGRAFRLADLRGHPLLVEFFYTSCPTICGLLVSRFRDARDHLAARPPARPVSLLSVSFDPQRDTVAALADFADQFGVDGHTWHLARVDDSLQLRRLLDAFGIVVLPDRDGGFTHNAAVYRLDATGRLAGIYDPDQTAQAVADAGR